MQGLAWPLTPIIGQVFKGFAYTRQGWTKAKPSPFATWSNVQVFTASGRYTPSDNLVYAIVECIGPGGGGGWATGDLDGITHYSTAAGGGGSGGYSKSTLPAELLIQGADVVIGVGGIVSAGTIGGGVTATDTSFGGLCVAHGGGNAQAFDGSGTVASAHGMPGAGALAGTGDLAEPGAAGGMWTVVNINIQTQHLVGAAPGLGGQLMGGARWPTPLAGSSWLYTSTNGSDGLPNTGAGGGGAQINGGPGTMFGGRGGSGLCVVTEICSTDTESPGPGPIEPPVWPPGVPVNVKARVAMFPADPCGPHVEPVK